MVADAFPVVKGSFVELAPAWMPAASTWKKKKKGIHTHTQIYHSICGWIVLTSVSTGGERTNKGASWSIVIRRSACIGGWGFGNNEGERPPPPPSPWVESALSLVAVRSSVFCNAILYFFFFFLSAFYNSCLTSFDAFADVSSTPYKRYK